MVAYNNYYPFGMLLPNRHGSSDKYRYGFQGQEKDDELKGEGNSLSYTFRMHDPRVGRFFAIDPLIKKYPHYSSYSFAGNKVVAYSELEGEEEVGYVEKLDYNGNAFDYLKSVPNAAISLNNSVNVIWNSGVATVKKIYNDGFFSYGKALGEEIALTGEGIAISTGKLYDYTVNTPAKQQLKDFGKKVSSPEFLESSISFVAEAYVGSKSFIGPQLPVKKVSPIVTNLGDVSTKLASIRKKFNISKGKNIAWVEGKIDNQFVEIVAHSGSKSSKAGTSPVPSISRFFETNKINRNSFDSEIKILEDFARRYENNLDVKGEITIFSERSFCDSCRDALFSQFKKIFKNVEIKVGADGIDTK